MADQVTVTYSDDTVTVISVADQGPPGLSGSSVPATTSTLGGIIVGANLTILANGLLSATGGGGSATTNLPWANITSKPTFANIATSGLYTDLTGTPNLGIYLTAANLTGYLLFSIANATYSVLGHTHAFGTLTAIPNTLAGYNITDSLTAATAAATYALQATIITAGTGLTGGGSLSTGRTLALATSGATAGVYGSATVVPVVTVDVYGRITAASNTTIAIASGQVSGLAPSATTDTTNANNVTSGTLANARLGVSNSTLTYAANTTWSADYLKVATLPLTGACNLTISGLSAGGTYNLIVKQDATGSRIVTYATTVKWSAGAAPTLSTAANATDIVSFIYDGTTLFGTALKGFA